MNEMSDIVYINSLKSITHAVHEGRLDKVQELISSFSSFGLNNVEKHGMLCDALELKHIAIAKLLITSGVDGSNCWTYNAPLLIAAKIGYTEVVQMILDKGANINVKDKKGRTSLHNAIKAMNMDVTELLLKHKADVNASDKKGISPLHVAAEMGNLQIVEILLNYEARVDCMCYQGYTPLYFAIERNKNNVITMLLDKGANIDAKDGYGRTLLHNAISCMNTDVYSDNDGISPLHIAAQMGNLQIVEILLKYEARVDCMCTKGYTPLHFAVERSKNNVITMLLDSGANIDAIDVRGSTPLHIAVSIRHCDIEIVKMILSKGDNISAKDKRGRTSLHNSIEYMNMEAAELLLEHKADVNACDNNGISALYLAAMSGNLQIVECVLKYGANVNCVKLHKKYAPLHCAVERGIKEVIAILLSKGANIEAKDYRDRTPLFLDRNFELVEQLIKSGANVNSVCKGGRTPLRFAVERYDKDVVKLLLSRGAIVAYRDDFGRTPLHAVTERYRYRQDIVDIIAKYYVLQMKTALVTEENVKAVSELISQSDAMSKFQCECEKEMAHMKSTMIINTNISFFDILIKRSSLSMYMRNENIVQTLKSGGFKDEFPIYACIIEDQFKMAMERKELLDQGHIIIFHFLFPALPYVCTEKILSYLSIEDLNILLNACKELPCLEVGKDLSNWLPTH